MSQLSFFDIPDEPIAVEPPPQGPRPIHCYQVRVPVETGEAERTADALHKIIRRLYDETREMGCFHQWLRIVYAALRRFEVGEGEYMELIKGWSTKALALAKEGLQLLISHFWHDGFFYDVLGDVYMRVRGDWAGKLMGQYFTPWSLCTLMAQQIMGDADPDRLANGPIIKVYDPACGSGAMLLAARAALVDAHGTQPDPRRVLRYVDCYGQDLDEVCILMCRIQMRMSDDRWMTPFMLATYGEMRRRA